MEGFVRSSRSYGELEKTVYIGGSGPGIVVMHEMPGLHPGVHRFALDLVEAGFTVWMPSLFGTDERPTGLGYAVASIARGCVAREFHVWRSGSTSPVIDWLRPLAHELSQSTGGPVGAVGMCFTGGFALAMMVDPWVQAPVLSQPSLPFGVFPWQRRDLGIDDETLAEVRERAAAGACLMGLRYRNDPMVPPARFRRLRQELGEAFVERVVDDWRPWKHSVLATHRHDPSVREVIAFFRQHLVEGGLQEHPGPAKADPAGSQTGTPAP